MMTYYGGGFIDDHGNAIERTPLSHPHNYEGHVIFRGGPNSEISHSDYTDRLRGWKPEKYRALLAKYFKDAGDYWPKSDSKKIEAFLNEYYGIDDARLILVMQFCSQNGNPYWRLDYNTRFNVTT